MKLKRREFLKLSAATVGALDGAVEVLQRYLAPWFDRNEAAVAAADVGGVYGALTPFLDAAIKEVVREAQA